MTADEYVPTEEDAVDNYVSGRGGDDPGLSLPELRAEYGPEFDRFLARVRRDAKAEAWDACVDEAAACGWTTGYASRDVRDRNPYRETGDSDDRR